MFWFHSIFVIFQANCPDYQPDVPLEEKRKAYYFGEDMTWEPGRIHDHDLVRPTYSSLLLVSATDAAAFWLGVLIKRQSSVKT